MTDLLKALILGIVQGLTEFLPVSSSGHIELGKALLGVELEDDLTFSIIVHFATVLSTIVVFRKQIGQLIRSFFTFKWNEDNKFISYLFISAVPIVIIGFTLKGWIEELFTGKLILVGLMLLVTAALLLSTTLFQHTKGKLTWWKALIIGLAQAIAILPGISRSGATISTALNLGVNKEKAAQFSFLMVLLPIIGASLLELKDIAESKDSLSIDIMPMFAGFMGAFLSGWLACSLMLKIVKQGKIQYFAYYCIIVGLITLVVAWT